ncbi:MAG TPA: DNA gyrase inhibitor YacG [Bryobacteraceae bacterium]|nr:DNA gyrase inhibitor YacG [Bryobacteraceae bacterium]
MSFPCPICKKPVEAGVATFPFCSERCRTIDLGNWAAEKYVISTPVKPSGAAPQEGGDGSDEPS